MIEGAAEQPLAADEAKRAWSFAAEAGVSTDT
jgi:hypothetical protein